MLTREAEVKSVLTLTTPEVLLERLVDLLREEAREAPLRAVSEFTVLLEQNPPLLEKFSASMRGIFANVRLVNTLAESGIITGRGIGAGIRRLLSAALLPRAVPDRDIRHVLRSAFQEQDDWEWIDEVPDGVWARLFRLVIKDEDAVGLPHEDVAAAVRALSLRIGALGIDEEVNAKLYHVEDYDSPFMDLPVVALRFLEDHRHGRGSRETLDAVVENARECRELVLHLRDNKARYGTSLRLTAVTRRLLQQLDRLALLLHIIHPNDPDDFARAVVPIFKKLIKSEQTAGSFLRVVRQNLDLVAYQITEHSADRGAKYMARTSADYFAFLKSALLGGALVAVFAVFKLFLAKLDLPLAAQAILYGINYSLCFILIYVTGAILATKQPAVTASTLARVIDSGKDRQTTLREVADVIVLIWRGQFISFVGNLVCAFPVSVLIAYALEQLLGIQAADVEKSRRLLEANHPWRSAALFYACIAGVFLFLAGAIQGAVENRIVYIDLRERLLQSGYWDWLGRRRERVVDFLLKNASGIAGNTALGFMLGSAGTIGVIFGLPFDIRHIAFSSAHFGVATLDAPQLVSPEVIYYVMVGILGIGLLNFFVSFGLTLFVTFRSRGVSFESGGQLVRMLILDFLRRPHVWFFPVGRIGKSW